ncbi:MAG: 3-methyl-2-oxobutanoate hydroxymethyltransferase [Vulcanibacillus sp.]
MIMNKVTALTFQKMKDNKQNISMLTAYDYPMARLIDDSGVDAILVGDSLGMVVLGYEDTTQVTMEDMIHHCKAVSNGVKRAMVIADMPFISYHLSKEKSVYNAGRLIQEGKAQAVKLEGGEEITEDIRAIIKAGIPVMGHIGLTPQSIHKMGGYFVQGKTEEQAKKLINDAIALEKAGVFSIVLESMPVELSKIISEKLTIPTIGIGAGVECDGQVLVSYDMLGLFQGKTPKFAKKYNDLSSLIIDAVTKYVQDVNHGIFPREEQTIHVDSKEFTKNITGDNQ